jgi:hypothetical protein
MPTRANVQENDTAGTPASSLTLSSYTPSAGSNRVLEVQVFWGDTISNSLTCAFGGVSMTSRAVAASADFAINTSTFTLNESAWPSTPANIVATLGTGAGGIRIVASTITDVDQTTPMDATPVTVGTSGLTTWSIGITTVTNDALVSAAGCMNDTRTLSSVGGGQDQVRLDTDAVTTGGLAISRSLVWEDAIVPTAGAVTMTATWNSAGGRNAITALAYRPAVAGPTIDTEPTAQTIVLTNDDTVSFSVAASGTGTVDILAEIESAPASGSFGTLANGSGATWTGLTGTGSGSASTTLAGTITAKTLSGRKVRFKVDDDNGTAYSDEVLLNIFDGPSVTTFPATDGSGESTATLTCDYVTGVGEAIEVRIPLSDGDVAVTVTTT